MAIARRNRKISAEEIETFTPPAVTANIFSHIYLLCLCCVYVVCVHLFIPLSIFIQGGEGFEGSETNRTLPLITYHCLNCLCHGFEGFHAGVGYLHGNPFTLIVLFPPRLQTEEEVAYVPANTCKPAFKSFAHLPHPPFVVSLGWSWRLVRTPQHQGACSQGQF